MVNKSLLIVDRDRGFSHALADALASNGFPTRIARDEHEALEEIEASRPSMILLDSQFSQDGLMHGLAIRGIRLPIVLMTSADGAQKAHDWGITAYMEKGGSAERFLGAICICNARAANREEAKGAA